MARRLENKAVDIEELRKTSEFFDGKRDIGKFGAGDSFYIAGALKKGRKDLFDKIMVEAKFVQMFNIGKDSAAPIPRLVTAQSERNEDGAAAIYRMPGCNEKNIATTEWTPTVKYVCDEVSAQIKQTLNHCVLSLYRDENDSLGFHKDKLLDIEDQSLIISASFGDTRPILFHSLDGRHRQTIMLKPGSILAIGPKTNRMYMHSIPKLTEPVGPRVSLSLRYVSTFIKYEDLPAITEGIVKTEEKVKTEEEVVKTEEEKAEISDVAVTEDTTTTKRPFKIIGKGAEFQCVNYPFTKSHDDEEVYSEATKKDIKKFTSLTTTTSK